MKHAALFLMTAFLTAAVPVQPVGAQQNFEDFIKKSRKDFDEMKNEADKKFEELRNSIDKEFAGILDQAWKELELNTGKKFDQTPKPDNAPVARPEPQKPEKEAPKPPEEKPPVKPPEKQPEIRVPEEKPAPKPPEEKRPEKEAEKPTPPPLPPQPERKTVPPQVSEGEPLSIVFYDTPETLTFDTGMKINIGNAVSEKSISTYWMAMSERKYLPLLKQVYALKEHLSLNDWGYCLFLDTIAQSMYGRATNDCNLFVWFMLVQSGYDARIGYSDNRVYLLLP